MEVRASANAVKLQDVSVSESMLIQQALNFSRQAQKDLWTIAELKHIVASAKKWQQRSWIKRAFIRWEPPVIQEKAAAYEPVNNDVHSPSFLAKDGDLPAAVQEGHTAGRFSDAVHFHLESPSSEHLSKPILTLSGWVFSETVSLSEIRLIIGQRIYAGSYPIKRIDVAGQYELDAALMSGFQFPDLFLRGNDREVRIEVRSTDGEWFCMTELVLKVPMVQGDNFSPIPSGDVPELCIYYNSRGHYFFREIAAYLQHCFKEIGCRAMLVRSCLKNQFNHE